MSMKNAPHDVPGRVIKSGKTIKIVAIKDGKDHNCIKVDK